VIKYSFVIPTYNCKHLLKNVLHSLNAQIGYEQGGYEVIIADDGSTDGTEQCISEMAKNVSFNFKLNYIYLERTPGSCRSRTRNIGWQAAQGKFVIFLDADIIVKNDYLQQLDAYFSKEPNLLIIGTRLMLNEPVSEEDVISGKAFDLHRIDKEAENFYTCEGRHLIFNKGSYNASAYRHSWLLVYSCNMAMPRKNLEITGGFEEGFKGWGMEDQELGYKAVQSGLQVVINPRLEVLHQFHGAIFGTVSTVRKFIEWKKNLDIFYWKHPEFKKEVSKLKYIRYNYRDTHILLMRKTPSQEHVIEFKDPTELESVKETILELSSRENLYITVRDYVEETDLALWIQLLGQTKAVIRYFPMSKVLDDDRLNSFVDRVYQKNSLLTFVNLSTAFCLYLLEVLTFRWNARVIKNKQ